MIGEIKVDSSPLLLPGYYVLRRDGEVVSVGVGWPPQDADYDRITVHPGTYEAIKIALDGKPLPS